jgi:glycosyltransferase involved in cell wall biosynthesis
VVRVSVVIPAYNAERYLHECLASVLSQAGDFELEVLVVDDGSSDGTVAMARSHAGVHCLSQPNRGPSAARNAGIAAGSGELVAFLDADDLWPPGKLASQVDLLQRHPQLAMVFGDCRQFDADGPRPRTEFEAGGHGRAAWGAGPAMPDAYARLLHNNVITTGSVVVRRAALAAAGGFAEDLRLVEDLDQWLRIAHDHPIGWCDDVCLLRRRHDSNISGNQEQIGLAFLEVLARHARRWHPADPAARDLDAGRLAAHQYLHLADLASRRGDRRTAWQRVGQAVRASRHPAAWWHAVKTSLRLSLASGAGGR